MTGSWIFSLLYARKLIILIVTGFALLGGITVQLAAPPRYKASARVVLDFVKPDPVTGVYLHNNRQADAYIRTQLQKAGDYQVTIPAAEAVGWLDSPDVLAAYASRPTGDQRPLQQWVADQFMSTTSTTMVPGSNIMQIDYRGSTPELSLTVVEALREAFIGASVQERRQSAADRADALAALAEPMKAKIAELEAQRAQYARETGIILAQDGANPANRTMVNLAKSVDRVIVPRQSGALSERQSLAALDAQVARAAETLGPNNPQLLRMRRHREVLAAEVAARQNQGAAMEQALAGQVRLREQHLQTQRASVLDEREEVLQLRIYQDQIDHYRASLNKSFKTIAELRALSNSTAAGVTPMGEPFVKSTPVFPNPYLILFGTGGLGLVLGSFLAMLAELMHRRVRTPHDLELAAGQPILGAVPYLAPRSAPARRAARHGWVAPGQGPRETIAA